MAKDYQAVEKERRAKKHNEALSRLEKAAVPQPSGNEHSANPPEASEEMEDPARAPPRYLLEIESRAWLYMERVKPGLTKKLAHRWHGPFRIKRKVEEFAYELELPDRSVYRFYPLMHLSGLKAVNEFSSRPKPRLVLDATNNTTVDEHGACSEINRQHEVALTMAKDYQAVEKKRRAKKHNEALSRLEKAAVPQPSGNEHSANPPEASEEMEDPARAPPRSLFEIGSRAWLYMERVKPGLTKKLAHQWHGPFRIKRKVEEFAYDLELPDRSGYRFYPVVHVSRLKAVNEFNSRPNTRLVLDATNEARLDFDEELLPEDSWEPDQVAGEYEVEAILDDRTPLTTSTERAVREFKVKWVGYEDTTWEPSSNLSCGGLLYDYLRAKKSENRLQMAQVADED
ncbi:hypothetical protein PInf_002573 [Phytophthora infestans]|nr:hypothetical protein PInf_002573 [Phytophthora infestans]